MTTLLAHKPTLLLPERIGKKGHPGYALTPEGEIILLYLSKRMSEERKQSFRAHRSKKLDEAAMEVVMEIGLSSGKGPGHNT